MAERRFLPLDFSKGLYFTNDRERIVPEGFAREWANFRPTPNGELLPRGNWFRGTQTGTAPTEVASLYYSPLGNPIGGIFTAEKTGTDVEIRRSSGPYSAPIWNLVDTLVGIASGSWNLHVPFATGLNRVLYGNTSFPSDRLRIWDGAAAADASSAAVAGRTLAFHKERFFSGGTDANGSRLHYSGLGVPTDWDVERYIDVRASNGGTIVDACPVNQGLLIAKTTSLHLLEGDGPGTFQIQDIMGGEGTMGRCIVPTPYGAIIVGSSGIYLWTGAGTVEQIVPSGDYVYFDPATDGGFPAYTAYVKGIVYAGSRFQNAVWAIDLVQGKRWLEFVNVGAFSEDVFHFDGLDYISVMTGAGFASNYDNDVLIGAGITGATAPGVSYQTNNRSVTDVEFPETFRVSKQQIQLSDSPGHPATLEHIHFAFTGAGAGGSFVVTATELDTGISQTWTIVPSGEDHVRADFGVSGYRFEIEIVNQTAGLNQQAKQIQNIMLEYEVSEAR